MLCIVKLVPNLVLYLVPVPVQVNSTGSVVTQWLPAREHQGLGCRDWRSARVKYAGGDAQWYVTAMASALVSNRAR